MKTGILLVAYGAANNHNANSLRRFQDLAERRFRLPVRWAYTSELNRRRMALARAKSDSVGKALSRMRFDGYGQVAVQSLHVVPGLEFEAMLEEAGKICDSAFAVSIGQPLITEENGDEDLQRASACLLEHLPAGRAPEQPVLLMAHGSPSPAGRLYERWAQMLAGLDAHLHLACMESPPYFSECLERLRLAQRGPVWLVPLLSTLGKHSLNDLTGPGADSWQSGLKSVGLACRAELRGLIDNPRFAAAWLDRLGAALDDLPRRVQE